MDSKKACLLRYTDTWLWTENCHSKNSKDTNFSESLWENSEFAPSGFQHRAALHIRQPMCSVNRKTDSCGLNRG
jgi:hypothetical protein